MSPRPGRTGASLLEITIATGATVLLLALLFRTNTAASMLTSTALTDGRLQESASQTLQTVGADLRWARATALLLTDENGSTRADYFVAEDYDGTDTVWSSQVVLHYEPSDLDEDGNGVADEGRLVRIQDGRTRTLCRNVREGGFSVARVGNRLTVSLSIFGTSRDGRLLEATEEHTVVLVNHLGL